MDRGNPTDMGGYYRAHGANGARRGVEENQRPFTPGKKDQEAEELPPIVDIMDFLATPLPKPIAIVQGLLDKGSKMILSGSPKTRKTWTLTHLAVCVATGQPWWDFKVTRGKVLYINLEIDAPFFRDRVQEIKEKLVLDGQSLKGQLHLWNLRGHAADIKILVSKIINRMKKDYDLVIIDPIYKVLGDRDENSNGDIADMMNHLDVIIKDTGAAVVFAHHFSKGNQARKEAMDRMSGAGAFGRDADTLLSLTQHLNPDTYVVDITVRNHKHIESFCVSLDHPIMERWEGGDPSKLKTNNGPEPKYHLADLMKTLNIQHLTRKELENQYREATKASEGTFDKLFKKAQEKPDVIKCEEGKKWKAVTPIYPPGYNACRSKEEEASATVQG